MTTRTDWITRLQSGHAPTHHECTELARLLAATPRTTSVLIGEVAEKITDAITSNDMLFDGIYSVADAAMKEAFLCADPEADNNKPPIYRDDIAQVLESAQFIHAEGHEHRSPDECAGCMNAETADDLVEKLRAGSPVK